MSSLAPSEVNPTDGISPPAAKKVKVSDARAGVADIKPEFLLHGPNSPRPALRSDDAAEAAGARQDTDGRKRKFERGQNKGRKFHFANDEVKLCNSLVLIPREGQFEGTVCEFVLNERPKPKSGGKGKRNPREVEAEVEAEAEDVGRAKPDGLTEKCAFSHNLREYLQTKRDDVGSVCPVWEERGWCGSGWRCRWIGSHSKEDEKGELYLVVDEERKKAYEEKVSEARRRKLAASKVAGPGDDRPQDWEKEVPVGGFDDPYGEVVNAIPVSVKIQIRKNKFRGKKSEIYQEWVEKEKESRENEDQGSEENRAAYVEAPVNATEKRRIYIGKDTPLLAPLTTTGNLPFRRLCTSLGASLTYSEMAMSLPLLQGHKPEWALLKSHVSELPNFGAQICGTKVGIATRVTEVLTTLFPSAASSRYGLSLIDLNCGCPIDLVFRQGGGSSLLEQPNKLIKMLKGMNYVSGETPITCKIRMGTKDSHPVAKKIVQKIYDAGDVQAITLHGRSRQQRYARAADWTYIAETATLIKELKEKAHGIVDTAADKEGKDRPNVWFIGNGDCYSHHDYYEALGNGGVDGVMVARGALIKPWIFEEIEKGQYLDKSATERLDYIREYSRYGLECWGSDEFGVATTRRFLLEWLSFACRYVPIGILERLPPRIQDRPPAWKGRNELESLLGSSDYRDWIKISEMFLGPCPDDFHFTPKHKSSAHEDIEAEG